MIARLPSSLVERLEDQKRLLEEANRQIELAGRRREEFVAIVAHEIRSPLTVIKGALDLIARLGDTVPAETRADLLNRSRNQANRVITLAGELLDLERIESGALPSNLQVMDIVEVVRKACDDLGPTAREQEMTISASSGVDTAPLVADAEAVRRIVVNLVSNAIKYAPRGSTVDVSIRAREEAWRVEVADRGPGIPDGMKSKVFERFVRLGHQSRGPSSGLGLAIVRSLVDQQGGRLGVDDRPGGGSAFWFELPARGAAAAEEPRPTTCVVAIGLEPSRLRGLERDLSDRSAAVHVLPDVDSFFAASGIRDLRFDAAVVDSSRPDVAQRLFALLREMEARGVRRVGLLPSGAGPGSEIGRSFELVRVFGPAEPVGEVAGWLLAAAP